MDRKTSALDVNPLRALDDEELSAVSGGHRRHHHCHRRAPEHEDGGSGGYGGMGGLDWLLQMISQSNTAAIFQFVFGNGNTVSAGVSQTNVAP